MDATCHVYLKGRFWHWELRRSDESPFVMCVKAYETAEEAEEAMEEAAAAIRAGCETFFRSNRKKAA